MQGSVIVRAKNEAKRIVAALQSVRAQTVSTEIVLVDSGSTDETREVASPFVDRLIRIRPEEFTFGGALNTGAREAAGDVMFALSAHCALPDPRWIERSLAHFADDGVSAAFGTPIDPEGAALTASRVVSFSDLRRDPRWGMTNQASAWRRSTWERFPFDDCLRSCEDKEWMWRVMLAGWQVIADPTLVVSADHRRAAGVGALWRRVYHEHRAMAERLEFPPQSLAAFARTWWSSFPYTSTRPPWQRRVSPWRNVELTAGFVGDRVGARRRGSQTLRLPGHPSPPT